MRWLCGGDPVGMDGDEIGRAGLVLRGWSGGSGRSEPGGWTWRTICSTSGSRFENKIELTDKGFFDLPGQAEPVLSGPGERSPKEQMTFWRGPLGVWTD